MTEPEGQEREQDGRGGGARTWGSILQRHGERYGWTENQAPAGERHDYRVFTAPLPER